YLTRSSSSNLHIVDPEIDRTFYRLRKARSTDVGGSISFISVPDSINNNCTTNHSNFFESNSFDFKPNIADNMSYESEQMENINRTLKELATLDVLYQPWCIQYPQLKPTQSYELKFGLIHLLPKFHGLAGEDPHKHLMKFYMVCSTMRPQGIPEDYIKMKGFSFSQDGAAKDWLYLQSLPKPRPSAKRFVELGNSMEKLCMSTRKDSINYMPHVHTITSTSRLMMMDRNMIDIASDGALMDKTPIAVRHLILNMASNTQQFRTKGAVTSRVANEVGTIDKLSDAARCQTTIAECASESLWHMYLCGAPNNYVLSFSQQQQQQGPPQDNSPLIEEWMKQMNECNMQFQRNLNATIQDLKI
ncbi:hypothetical protein CR513_34087, partial [Mucuna pruriens]